MRKNLCFFQLDSKIDYWPSLIPVLFNTNITPCKKNVFGVGLEEVTMHASDKVLP